MSHKNSDFCSLSTELIFPYGNGQWVVNSGGPFRWGMSSAVHRSLFTALAFPALTLLAGGFKRWLHARISGELETQANKNTPDLAVGADLHVALFAFPFFCPRYTKIIVMCSQGCESLLSSRKVSSPSHCACLASLTRRSPYRAFLWP